MTNNSSLNAQIQTVAKLRRESQLAKERLDMAKAAWEAEHAGVITELLQKTEETQQAEDELRRLTLEAYVATKDKKPAEGVGIRIIQKLAYNEKEALIYAMQHGVALKLDVASFEKMCRIPELKPGFVTKTEVPQATISPNLGKVETDD